MLISKHFVWILKSKQISADVAWDYHSGALCSLFTSVKPTTNSYINRVIWFEHEEDTENRNVGDLDKPLDTGAAVTTYMFAVWMFTGKGQQI